MKDSLVRYQTHHEDNFVDQLCMCAVRVLCVYMCECVCNVNVYTIIIIIACVPWAPLPAKLAPKLHREVHVV